MPDDPADEGLPFDGILPLRSLVFRLAFQVSDAAGLTLNDCTKLFNPLSILEHKGMPSSGTGQRSGVAVHDSL